VSLTILHDSLQEIKARCPESLHFLWHWQNLCCWSRWSSWRYKIITHIIGDIIPWKLLLVCADINCLFSNLPFWYAIRKSKSCQVIWSWKKNMQVMTVQNLKTKRKTDTKIFFRVSSVFSDSALFWQLLIFIERCKTWCWLH